MISTRIVTDYKNNIVKFYVIDYTSEGNYNLLQNGTRVELNNGDITSPYLELSIDIWHSIINSSVCGYRNYIQYCGGNFENVCNFIGEDNLNDGTSEDEMYIGLIREDEDIVIRLGDYVIKTDEGFKVYNTKLELI